MRPATFRKRVFEGVCMALILLALAACAGTDGGAIVQRCPALIPPEPVCPAWTFEREAFPENPSPIEALKERYATALEQLEKANAVVLQCRARDRVWEGAWSECGE